MKILFIVPYPTEGASNRYRVEQYLPYLDARRIYYQVHSFASSSFYKILYRKGGYVRKSCHFLVGYLRRFWDVALSGQYDIVFVHREACPIGPALFEWLFWMRRASIVFDFDDAIFLRNVSSANAWLERLKCPGKIESILSWSHHVIAGNGYLAEFARRYNRNVSVLSTPVDTDRYVPRHGKRPSSKEVIVGWIGTPTTAGYLNLLSEVLPPLLKRHQNIRFRVIGANPADWRVPQVPDRIEHRDWSLQTELQELQEFDLGLMPMPDTDWARGKCGHKALLYMSVGIPVVASPVGVACEILEGHQGGFLASSAEEWQENLSQLIEDVSFRKQMGLAGRARVEARYSLRNNAPKLVSLLEEAYVQRHDNG